VGYLRKDQGGERGCCAGGGGRVFGQDGGTIGYAGAVGGQSELRVKGLDARGELLEERSRG